MTSPNPTTERLLNLEKIRQIKSEPHDQGEFERYLQQAQNKLRDASNQSLSADSRFILAYDAAFALSFAALRWHGYRPDNVRQTVFAVLDSTTSLPKAKARFLTDCHGKRNVALYEGAEEAAESLIAELIAVTHELQSAVLALGPTPIA